MTDRPIHLVYLNGWSLAPAVLRAMAGRPVAVLGRNFAFRPFAPILNRLADAAESSGLFRPLYELCPCLEYFREFLGYADRTDLFAKTLAAQAALYHFQDFDRTAPDYAIAAKHAACNNTRLLAPLVVQMKALADAGFAADLRVHGVDADALSLYESYTGRTPPFEATARRELRPLVNALHALMLLAYGVVWLLRRVGKDKPPARRWRLAADYTGANDRRGFQLVREISDAADDVLYVFRRPNPSFEDVQAVADYAQAAIGEGGFAAKDAFGALCQLFADTLALARLSFGLSPELFLQVAAMPLRRLAYRAFFNRYPCDFFLARDDYNSEHSLRSQELRKIGGKTLGIMHAIPSDNDQEPSMWFVDFDYYYCFGKRIVEQHVAWPPSMKARLTGAWAMSRDHARRLKDPRPKDIIFYGRGGLREGEMIDVARRLAAHFQDRRIYIKLKAGNKRYPRNMPELMRDLPANVVVIDPAQDTYELMFQAQYAFSSGSTVIAEALHFGLKAFVFDLHPELPFVFRNFPALIVDSADRLIARIEAIEADAEPYDWKPFNDLIAMDGPFIFDAIRADMGQALKSAA